ncbi:bifunctional DNA-formamidopyrimidine glycosylase/DNA-(apurinic or apyrimidinic site) lyase [Amycolatopsis sp. PS_44_ISF1]|uniref:bifunctional DNA-formamidopyrimidine glycosylase/DNA-(apurinic or apyrimidinic site) lyase n=1 Tax=Amycolatopsis sp. PS_44_ISF1 TaxID=2974917 RepID=UPI0028DECD2F|nr:bifunctional DNA-formamidopyrimidine glycosylase/DNA-(apurinic or apyrimidinic site) lyase [Amycolatopsis sp. PS_44_ISF1]MDT8915589.1 bifunctional DNA-formamidopyrimidine glycosylase/DNA-(apurinic or apyrimidinic site) lyase [Amycolatopsis sp. PS_44_ISF1]
MPELPEVEVVRAGLQAHAAGRTVSKVEVLHPRAIRRHGPGAEDFTGRLAGVRIEAARRRGKYLWLELSDGEAVLAHLGMSGQMLVQPEGAPDEKHLRVRFRFADDGPELRFVDQRTFGGLALDELVTDDDERLPGTIAHIARDPMDPRFDPAAAARALRSRRTEIKRALLDQTLVSGVGNIYADEALWRSKLHGSRPADKLTAAQGRALVTAATEVMDSSLQAGGTSFDALYVNVNGQSGYFSRSLDAYGQEGLPCRRCGTAIRREPFMNRSSYSCPRCQPRPRSSR